jgi:class 3 adenylate cyclase
MRQAIERHKGYVFKTIGDAFCAAFADSAQGVAAAIEAQQSLSSEPWEGVPGIRARMALHVGDPVCRDNDYFGPTVNRVARILSAGHGGQTIISAAVRERVNGKLPQGVTVVAHGSHRLKDLVAPEALFGLLHPDLPRSPPTQITCLHSSRASWDENERSRKFATYSTALHGSSL